MFPFVRITQAAPTELGLIYRPKSTNRSRLTALSIRRCAGRLFNTARFSHGSIL
jgi:hypothetical protein